MIFSALHTPYFEFILLLLLVQNKEREREWRGGGGYADKYGHKLK
jgi:hypothetical protein